MSCLKCGDTGLLVNGKPCDCGCKGRELVLPTYVKIPKQYQGITYHKNYIRHELQDTLGSFMEGLLKECVQKIQTFNKNYIICAPANSGKTVWAYNLYSELYSRGFEIPDIMDLMQVRDILLNYYSEDKELITKINTAKIMVIKLPMDLPNKFPETISTIVERRVRNDCSTIFLYNGTGNDLESQDRFGKLKYLLGDGSYNSVCLKSF